MFTIKTVPYYDKKLQFLLCQTMIDEGNLSKNSYFMLLEKSVLKHLQINTACLIHQFFREIVKAIMHN